MAKETKIEKENKTEKGIKLKVFEALQEDAYKGIARLDNNSMKSLGIKPGDVIIIKGERETVAIADKAYPSDSGDVIIRIDGIIRKNAKTGVGDVVTVKKADIKEAKRMVIAPTQKNISIQGDPEGLKQNLIGRVFLKGDIFVVSARRGSRKNPMGEDFGDMLGGDFSELLNNFFGGTVAFNNPINQIRMAVVSLEPSYPALITENTELILNSKAVDVGEEKGSVPNVTYEDIGGLNEEVKKIREMIELPLKHPELFERLGIEPPKGVLLYGPPGTGKTLLAKAVATETNANFIEFDSTKVIDKFVGETEKKIKKLFEEAESNAPTIIFIDELDSLAFKREERGSNDFLNTPVMELLKHMDGLKGRGHVVVIGATNRPDVIDPAFRRPGRFDREIEVSAPDKSGRLQILKIHTRNMPLTKDVDLEEIASITHGFVGADLASLCKEAAMVVIKRIFPDLKLKENAPLTQEVLDKLRVSQNDFKEALKFVQPSAMREVLIETPYVKWEDIGGLEKAKQEIKEAVELPLKNPNAFKRMGIKSPRGVLLYGPPGTGKTLLAKAVATETNANFISVKGPEVLTKWFGESEKGIRKIFKRAKQNAPAIIFFDEMDSLTLRRGNESNVLADKVLNQILAEMDGLEELKDVVVIGATNRPDVMDEAILRPGRFDRLIFIGSPTKEEREAIFKIHTKKMPIAKEISIKDLAEKTEKYNGADIASVCREAAMLALREDIDAKNVKKKHFDDAIKKIKPTTQKNQSYAG